jgi:predicted RND superfamily exporter protein
VDDPRKWSGCRAIAELGLISGTGVLIILFLTLTFFPALLSSWLELPPGDVPGAVLVIGLVFTLLCTPVVLPALIEWRQATSES